MIRIALLFLLISNFSYSVCSHTFRPRYFDGCNHRTPKESLKAFEVVFFGEITDSDTRHAGKSNFEFHVITLFKGTLGKQVLVSFGKPMPPQKPQMFVECGNPLTTARRWLIFGKLSKADDGTSYVDVDPWKCNPSYSSDLEPDFDKLTLEMAQMAKEELKRNQLQEAPVVTPETKLSQADWDKLLNCLDKANPFSFGGPVLRVSPNLFYAEGSHGVFVFTPNFADKYPLKVGNDEGRAVCDCGSKENPSSCSFRIPTREGAYAYLSTHCGRLNGMQVVLPAPIRKDWREVSSAPTDTLGAKHWVKKNEAPFIAFPFEKKLWATSSAPQVSPEAKTALIKAIDTLLSSHPSLAALEPCRQITRSADTQDLLDKLDKMK